MYIYIYIYIHTYLSLSLYIYIYIAIYLALYGYTCIMARQMAAMPAREFEQTRKQRDNAHEPRQAGSATGDLSLSLCIYIYIYIYTHVYYCITRLHFSCY